MAFNLGRRPEQWNAIVAGEAARFASIRNDFREHLACALMAETTASEFRVLTAITARTLRFRKVAEAIPLQQFCTGFRDLDGDLVRDGEGQPYFAGCNIAKADTISEALAGLERKQLITRWKRPRSTWATVYMPFTERWLAEKLAAERCPIAEDYEYVVPLEYLTDQRENFVRVLDVSEEGCLLSPVDNYLTEGFDQSFFLTGEQLAQSGYCRPTAAELGQRRR